MDWFNRLLDYEWRRSKRNKSHLSLFLVNIDFFKSYNKTYGLELSSECLLKIARLIQSSINRAGDVFAKNDKQEFIGLLSGTDIAGVKVVAERIREAVGKLQIPHEKSKISDFVTISIAIVSLKPSVNPSKEAVFQALSTALVKAKKNGGNQISAIDLNP